MTAHENKILGEGLTYDDVLLVPAFSQVLPREVNIQSKFTRNITINIPVVSAAMDTVTESKMAIAMAQEGGIGVLHKNMTIADQSAKVRRVKRAESGMIIDPVTLPMTAKVIDAKNAMREHSIGGIPIVDENGTLKGIVTNRDLRFEHKNDKPIVDVMTGENLVTAPVGTSLKDAEAILQANKIEKLLIVDGNYKLGGLITFRDITKVTQKPIANKDTYGRLRVAAAIGVTVDAVERAEALVKAGVDAVVIDTAHGHTKGVVLVLKEIKKKFPKLEVIVGNIATGDAAKYLVEAGADAVKVGIGPGSVCTTRLKTGVGYPQLSAVIECADSAHGLGGHIIADGGCTCPGDVAKAFAAGADFVMLGGMLAGHDEGGGDIITKKFITDEMNGNGRVVEEKHFVQFYGMSSDAANKKHFGGLKDYRSSEGREVLVPYRGPVAKTVQDLLGGIRSTCTYAGAVRLKHLSRCTTFVRCTQQFNAVYA